MSNLRGWLFRIAHNKAIDHLRRNNLQDTELLDDYAFVSEPEQPLEDKELATLALSLFLKLAPKQRSCVLLKDVMGYSLAEISELLDTSVSAIKAALHRGRSRLRELSKTVNTEITVSINENEQQLLIRYVDRFNARDFDAVRAMLADEVRLDLIGRAKLQEVAEVSNYFHNYSRVDDWRLALGTVEGRSAIVAYDLHKASDQPAYFILIEWNNGQVSFIRDYRYARYVIQDADVVVL